MNNAATMYAYRNAFKYIRDTKSERNFEGIYPAGVAGRFKKYIRKGSG